MRYLVEEHRAVVVEADNESEAESIAAERLEGGFGATYALTIHPLQREESET